MRITEGQELPTSLEIASKLGPEPKQLDVVSPLVTCDLDELIFMKMPFGAWELTDISDVKRLLGIEVIWDRASRETMTLALTCNLYWQGCRIDPQGKMSDVPSTGDGWSHNHNISNPMGRLAINVSERSDP